jgi:hypothetical protein
MPQRLREFGDHRAPVRPVTGDAEQREQVLVAAHARPAGG